MIGLFKMPLSICQSGQKEIQNVFPVIGWVQYWPRTRILVLLCRRCLLGLNYICSTHYTQQQKCWNTVMKRGTFSEKNLDSLRSRPFVWLLARTWIRKNTDCFAVYENGILTLFLKGRGRKACFSLMKSRNMYCWQNPTNFIKDKVSQLIFFGDHWWLLVKNSCLGLY